MMLQILFNGLQTLKTLGEHNLTYTRKLPNGLKIFENQHYTCIIEKIRTDQERQYNIHAIYEVKK